MSTRPGLARGGRIVPRTVALLRERDGDACGRCGGPVPRMGASGLDPEGPTIGHRVPAAKGGTDDMTNLRLEHRRCNLAAGARIASPRARIVAPVGLAVLIVGMLAGSAAAYVPTSESTLRAGLLSCAILREARLQGIPERRLPLTLASCRAVR